MTKKVRGSFTVEAAVIVPLILFVFGILLHTLFYYHDKNILMAVAHETASIGGGREATDDIELENYFYSRIHDKLLLFTKVENEVKIDTEQVQILCEAKKSPMLLKVECVMSRTDPEDYIRNIRKLEKIGEGIGK